MQDVASGLTAASPAGPALLNCATRSCRQTRVQWILGLVDVRIISVSETARGASSGDESFVLEESEGIGFSCLSRVCEDSVSRLS